MATLSELLWENGIRLSGYTEGNYKIRCPQCSHTRKNKSDPCLSITVHEDGAVWKCHHCDWSGSVSDNPSRPPARSAYKNGHRNGYANGHANGHRRDGRSDIGADHVGRYAHKAPKKIERPVWDGQALPEPFYAWFAKRGISREVVDRNKIGCGVHYFPALKGESTCLMFPYIRNGELINVKYRSPSKDFMQAKNAEKIFMGLDDLGADPETIIIVEGEIDKLSFNQIDVWNVLCFGDGAPKKVRDDPVEPDVDDKYSAVWNCREILEKTKKIILAVDGDEQGRALEEELARRIGKHKCWRVLWPQQNDALLKDANEVLVAEGPQVLKELLDNVEPYPIDGLQQFNTALDDVMRLYAGGRPPGLTTGWDKIDDYYRVCPGTVAIVTGIPSSGKSEWIDALCVQLTEKHGWRHGVCSFENPIDEHLIKLIEKKTRLPFWPGTRTRLTPEQIAEATRWINNNFFPIRLHDTSDRRVTIDRVLETARQAVLRYGIKGLIIDPYNELEHNRPQNMREDEYISDMLSKVKRFAQGHGVAVWFVAHPAKLPVEDGKVRVPTLYNISGGAQWFNKADVGIVVHRHMKEDKQETEVHVQKVRFKHMGRKGIVKLYYDRPTGCYYEDPINADGTLRSGDASQSRLPYKDDLDFGGLYKPPF